MSEFFRDLMTGLKQAEAYVNGERVKVRKSTLIIKTLPDYNSRDVKEIRKKLDLTQKIFANLLGVSLRTVESWETGQNKPNGASVRLMEIYNNHPELTKDIIRREEIIV